MWLVGDQEFEGRTHFFVAAAEAMRRILVEKARRKAALRHGGDRRRVTPVESHRLSESPEELLDLDDALTRFATVEPAKAKLVELRCFAGQSVNDTAAVLGISPVTAARWWEYARLWLYADL
jgi:RNA polymerase sigma factor (TIGR02999 family)